MGLIGSEHVGICGQGGGVGEHSLPGPHLEGREILRAQLQRNRAPL